MSRRQGRRRKKHTKKLARPARVALKVTDTQEALYAHGWSLREIARATILGFDGMGQQPVPRPEAFYAWVEQHYVELKASSAQLTFDDFLIEWCSHAITHGPFSREGIKRYIAIGSRLAKIETDCLKVETTWVLSISVYDKSSQEAYLTLREVGLPQRFLKELFETRDFRRQNDGDYHVVKPREVLDAVEVGLSEGQIIYGVLSGHLRDATDALNSINYGRG